MRRFARRNGESKVADNRIIAVKNGDKAAFEELLTDFEPLIRSETARLLAGAPDFLSETEELRQEGRLALYDAAMSYKDNDGVTFGLYAKICVKNRLISYLRKLSSKKRRADRAARRAQLDGARSADSADELFLAYERSGEVKRIVEAEATELEKTVFSLYMQRKSYADIAREIGKSAKSVDNAICRVKAKIRKYYK